MDRFWSSRCPSHRIDQPDKIKTFISCTASPLVVKNGTKTDFYSTILAKILNNGWILEFKVSKQPY